MRWYRLRRARVLIERSDPALCFADEWLANNRLNRDQEDARAEAVTVFGSCFFKGMSVEDALAAAYEAGFAHAKIGL